MTWKTDYRSIYYANAPEPETPVLTVRDTALLVIDVQNTYLQRPDRATLSMAERAPSTSCKLAQVLPTSI